MIADLQVPRVPPHAVPAWGGGAWLCVPVLLAARLCRQLPHTHQHVGLVTLLEITHTPRGTSHMVWGWGTSMRIACPLQGRMMN